MLEILLGALRISTPYILAALGGVLCERSGVINIALEGVLMMGALGCAIATHATGNPFVGMLCGMLVGLGMMAVHSALCVNARANNIIIGVGLNLVAAGAARFVLKVLYNSASNGPRTPGFEDTFWVHVQEVPILGEVCATPMVLLSLLLAPLLHLFFQRTPLGLHIRAVGEHPSGAESQGIPVRRTRWLSVCLGGMVAGLGGAYLAADQHQFTQNMSAGRGYIALAAVVFGQWQPLRVLLGCLLFGFSEALQIHLQSTQSGVPTQFVQMIPYLLTLGVLAFSMGKGRAPAALGKSHP